MTMPCGDFSPAVEFSTKKAWSTAALRLVQAAFAAGRTNALDSSAVEFQLRGEGRLFSRENDQQAASTWYGYGAGMFVTGDLSAVPNCSWSWTSMQCAPSDKCIRSGTSCVPRVTVASTGWMSVADQGLVSIVAPTVSSGRQPLSDLKGISVTLYCGEKRFFNDTGPGPQSSPSLRACLEAGVASNSRLRAEYPWKLFQPREVVVVAIFGALSSRQCQPAGLSGVCCMDALCFSRAEGSDTLDAHLADSEKVSQDGVYQGLHAGAGFPEGTPAEVVMRPEDVLEAAGLISRAQGSGGSSAGAAA